MVVVSGEGEDAGLAALLSPAGWALLASLPPYDAGGTMALGERLRGRGHEPALVAAAMTQQRLRARAAAKFGPFAAGMLFTATGLEQATRLEVAAHHAARYADASIARVADLGCGIGGDSVALAGLSREVLAVDADEATAAVAAVNLRHWPDARVRVGRAADVDLSGAAGADGVGPHDGVWVDPARRDARGRRVLDPRRASPSWEEVMGFAAAVPATGVKLAPGIDRDLAAGAPHGAETQWVSVDGDVVEAAVWCGPLARPGLARTALVLRGGRASEVTDAGLTTPDAIASLDDVGPYLHDPDGAVVRAGLVGQVAAALGGRLLDPSIAYVTSDRGEPTPLAATFAVREVMPFSLKTLRSHLRSRGVTRVEVLKRGSAVDVEDLRRRLRLPDNAGAGGAGSTGRGAALLLTRVAGRPVVVVAERVGATTPAGNTSAAPS